MSTCVQCGMLPILTWYAINSLETMLIITPKIGYGMAITPTTQQPSMNMVLSHLFMWSVIGVVGLRHIVFPNLKVGWASRYSGTQKLEQCIGKVAIVGSLQWGDNAFLCYNWNTSSSSANTSSTLINWYLSSPTKWLALYANPTHISSYCHSHNAWYHHGKTKNDTPHC